jgi:hypothetical protein
MIAIYSVPYDGHFFCPMIAVSPVPQSSHSFCPVCHRIKLLQSQSQSLNSNGKSVASQNFGLPLATEVPYFSTRMCMWRAAEKRGIDGQLL